MSTNMEPSEILDILIGEALESNLPVDQIVRLFLNLTYDDDSLDFEEDFGLRAFDPETEDPYEYAEDVMTKFVKEQLQYFFLIC